jgi:hypothetical protein
VGRVARRLADRLGKHAANCSQRAAKQRSETVDEPDNRPLRLRGYTELEASAVDLQSFVVRLRSLSLVIAPPAEDRAGLDGTTYHLALCADFMSEVRFRWWEEPPPTWRPLGEIVGEMIACFTNLPEKAG